MSDMFSTASKTITSIPVDFSQIDFDCSDLIIDENGNITNRIAPNNERVVTVTEEYGYPVICDAGLVHLTLSEIKEHNAYALKKLIQYAGNVAHLSRMINVSTTQIYLWNKKGKIPQSGVEKCMKNIHISRKFKRQDLAVDI